MKDIEKIKSEDLAAQVQDANPANFAIEQEVAQLVGATVPQPTQPSADDARELGAQLLVFLRRALLPIRSALRTAVADIYDYLDSRCTDYTPAAYDPFRLPAGPYDPMRPFAPRTLPNLLQALTAFSPRKISDLGDCPDGISLAHLLCGDNSAITEIKDDNAGWDASASKLSTMVSLFPSLTKLTINAKRILATGTVNIISRSTFEEIEAPDLEYFGNDESVWTSYFVCCLLNGTAARKVTMNKLNTIRYAQFNGYGDRSAMFRSCQQLEEIDADKLTTTRNSDFGSSGSCALAADCPSLKVVVTNVEDAGNGSGSYYGGLLVNCPAMEKLVVGKIKYTATSNNILRDRDGDNNMPNLVHLEIGEGTDVSLNFSRWNPTNVLSDQDKTATFLQNFKEHIALRLTANGSGKTLTLSQAVFSAVIEGSSPICDDIKGIIEDKGWKVQDTNNNIFPTT